MAYDDNIRWHILGEVEPVPTGQGGFEISNGHVEIGIPKTKPRLRKKSESTGLEKV